MRIINNTNDASRAAHVCTHCKSIKKGCDKKLPKCSQCIKRRAVCQYDVPKSRGKSRDANRSGGRNTPAWESSPNSVFDGLSPNSRLSAMLMDTIPDLYQSDGSSPDKATEVSTTDNILHSQICRILRSDNQYVDEISARYFASIHRWLPIISQQRFNNRLMDFQSLPTADFSMLLLAMRLITQPPRDSREDQDQDNLYHGTKTLFTHARSLVPRSIYLIQAGIIIATHEQSHGMIEAAYDTIGTAARMAFGAGLHRVSPSKELQGSEFWCQEEEALATWWGLVIRDRLIACEPRVHGRPLATKPIRDDECLALEPHQLDDNVENMINPPFRYFVCSVSLAGVGSFGREAQAVWLLDQVLVAVDADILNETRLIQLHHLDDILQPFLGTIIDQLGGRLGVYSGPGSVVVTALYILHRKLHSYSGMSSSGGVPGPSHIALNALTRLVIDTAYAFNGDSVSFSLDQISPSVAHVVRCAQQHGSHAIQFRTQSWAADDEELRKTLRFVNQRWRNAGMETGHFKQVVESPMPLIQYQIPETDYFLTTKPITPSLPSAHQSPQF